MTINRNNFEAYMLDYLEGNLDPLLSADLMAFLAENPEFEKYLPDYDQNISLSDTQQFIHKGTLRKEFSDVPAISSENFDEFCIGACEGLLNDRELNRLKAYISRHPDRQNDLDLFRKLKLQTDTSILFTLKPKVKKSYVAPHKLNYLYYALGIAASISLLILLGVKKPVSKVSSDNLPVKTVNSQNIVQPVASDTRDNVASVKSVPQLKNNAKSKHSMITTSSATGEQPETVRESLPLIPLKPSTKTFPISMAEPSLIASPLSKTDHSPGQFESTTSKVDKSSDSFAVSFLGSLITKVNFWKTAETAIQGFNYLTEAQLSIEKTTDEDGNLTGLLLGMESYKIAGNKIK